MYECNIFSNVWDADCTNVVPVKTIIQGIKNGRWKNEIELVRMQTNKIMQTKYKHKLPCATFSGVFEDVREDNNIVMYTSLMIIDIDKIGPRRLIELKHELKHNPYCIAYFDGPTKGIKVLFHVDTEAHEHNTYAFHCLQHHFMDMYKVEIDPSGKNISRLCFVSYDPALYVNPSPKVYPVDKSIFRQKNMTSVNINKNLKPREVKSVSEVVKICCKMVTKSKAGSYHKGNRNNFIFVLSCLLSDAGIPIEYAMNEIAQRYSSLEGKEIKSTVESAYRKTKHSFGTKPIGSESGPGGLFN